MIRSFLQAPRGVDLREGEIAEDDLPRVLWIDLSSPSPTELQWVERVLSIEMPSREEMREIETSSRLYEDRGALFMTMPMLLNADAEYPDTTSVTFVLTGHRLVTLRYAEPKPFRFYVAQALRHEGACGSGEQAFMGLIEAIVDRIADVLEQVSADLDLVSREVFVQDSRDAQRQARDFRKILARLGRNGDLLARVRESLVGMGRLLAFVSVAFKAKDKKVMQGRIKTASRDVLSLSDQASFLSNKVTFALDATLGMVQIEQNAIIKIFSVAAVVFLPPTLVASIYGMNFEFMPELSWLLGYPMALGLMVLSAILPYLYFKRRGWL